MGGGAEGPSVLVERGGVGDWDWDWVSLGSLSSLSSSSSSSSSSQESATGRCGFNTAGFLPWLFECLSSPRERDSRDGWLVSAADMLDLSFLSVFI